MEEEILSEVLKIIEWYKNNHSGATGDEILNFKDRLVTFNVNLGELVSQIGNEFDLAEYKRDAQVLSSKYTKLMHSYKIGQAETEAKQEAIALTKVVVELKSLFERYKRLLYQSNEVAKAMTQRLSILRKQNETT